MWFFMFAIYILSGLTFGMLLLLMYQNYNIVIPYLKIAPLTFLVLTSIIYSLTETLIIFFFVGTGVSVKEFSAEKNLGEEFRKKAFQIKMKVYPLTLLNILIMIVLFIMPGAVRAGYVSWIVYQYYFIFALWHFLYTLVLQHQFIKENTENILAMSGVTRPS